MCVYLARKREYSNSKMAKEDFASKRPCAPSFELAKISLPQQAQLGIVVVSQYQAQLSAK